MLDEKRHATQKVLMSKVSFNTADPQQASNENLKLLEKSPAQAKSKQ